MELSEFVTALVERNALYYPKEWHGYVTYYVNDNDFELRYVESCSSRKSTITVASIDVLPNHNDGIRLSFSHSDTYEPIQLKPVGDDDSDAFEYDAFELYRLEKVTI